MIQPSPDCVHHNGDLVAYHASTKKLVALVYSHLGAEMGCLSDVFLPDTDDNKQLLLVDKLMRQWWLITMQRIY